jgi:hypothetical protein
VDIVRAVELESLQVVPRQQGEGEQLGRRLRRRGVLIDPVAPDAEVAEVTTKEVPEDDVPPEYLQQD